MFATILERHARWVFPILIAMAVVTTHSATARAQTLYDQARTAFEADQPQQALLLLQQAQQLKPSDGRTLYEIGRLYIHLGRHQSAVTLYRNAAARFPDVPAFGRGLGSALRKNGQVREAVKVLKTLTHRWPNDPRNHNGLGVAFAAAGQATAALQSLERAAQKPGYEPGQANVKTQTSVVKNLGPKSNPPGTSPFGGQAGGSSGDPPPLTDAPTPPTRPMPPRPTRYGKPPPLATPTATGHTHTMHQKNQINIEDVPTDPFGGEE